MAGYFVWDGWGSSSCMGVFELDRIIVLPVRLHVAWMFRLHPLPSLLSSLFGAVEEYGHEGKKKSGRLLRGFWLGTIRHCVLI